MRLLSAVSLVEFATDYAVSFLLLLPLLDATAAAVAAAAAPAMRKSARRGLDTCIRRAVHGKGKRNGRASKHGLEHRLLQRRLRRVPCAPLGRPQGKVAKVKA